MSKKLAGLIKIDPERVLVELGGRPIQLTPSEFRILDLLVSNKEKVFSRERILDYLWKQDKAVVDRTIDVHISNLRKKIGHMSKYIKNVRGFGYKASDRI